MIMLTRLRNLLYWPKLTDTKSTQKRHCVPLHPATYHTPPHPLCTLLFASLPHPLGKLGTPLAHVEEAKALLEHVEGAGALVALEPAGPDAQGDGAQLLAAAAQHDAQHHQQRSRDRLERDVQWQAGRRRRRVLMRRVASDSGSCFSICTGCAGEGGKGEGGGEGGRVCQEHRGDYDEGGACEGHGAVRCSAVQCGAVWCGAGAVRRGAVRCGAVRCGAVRCGAVRCGTVRCGAVRCCAWWMVNGGVVVVAVMAESRW